MPNRVLIAASDDILRNILVRFMSQVPVVGVACGSAVEALGYLASGQPYTLVLAEAQFSQSIQSRYPGVTVLVVESPLHLEELGRRVRQLLGDPAPPVHPDMARPANAAAAIVSSVGAAGHILRMMI